MGEEREWKRTIKMDPHGDLGPQEEWVSRAEADEALTATEKELARVRDEWDHESELAEQAEAERDSAQAEAASLREERKRIVELIDTLDENTRHDFLAALTPDKEESDG